MLVKLATTFIYLLFPCTGIFENEIYSVKVCRYIKKKNNHPPPAYENETSSSTSSYSFCSADAHNETSLGGVEKKRLVRVAGPCWQLVGSLRNRLPHPSAVAARAVTRTTADAVRARTGGLSGRLEHATETAAAAALQMLRVKSQSPSSARADRVRRHLSRTPPSFAYTSSPATQSPPLSYPARARPVNDYRTALT